MYISKIDNVDSTKLIYLNRDLITATFLDLSKQGIQKQKRFPKEPLFYLEPLLDSFTVVFGCLTAYVLVTYLPVFADL